MPSQPDTSDYIRFEDEDGNALHVLVHSSQGNIPVRIDGVHVINRGSDRTRLSVDYQIDADHPDCPDLTAIDAQETVNIMMILKESIPKTVEDILSEAAEEEENERKLHIKSNTD